MTDNNNNNNNNNNKVMNSGRRTFKVINGNHIRRFKLEGEELGLNGLREKVQSLFKPPETCEFYFEYLDDDGDRIKMTEDYEFDDLLDLHVNDSVIKIALVCNDFRPAHLVMPRCFVTSCGGGGASEKSRATTTTFNTVTHRALCDATDAKLIFGDNWYHKAVGVDLCASAYEKLSDDEKKLFVKVKSAKDLGNEAKQYEVRKRGSCFRSKANCSNSKQHRPSCDANKNIPSSPAEVIEAIIDKMGGANGIEKVINDAVCETAPVLKKFAEIFENIEKSNQGGEQEGEGEGEGDSSSSNNDMVVVDGDDDGAGPSSIPVRTTTTNASSSSPLSAEFLSSSLDSNTLVKPGARLFPVFEVKNTSRDKIWTEVRLMPTEPNPFQVPEHGVEAPKLAPGESGLAMIDVLVPRDLAGQTVTARFALVDGNGNSFGDPLTVNVKVDELQKNSSPLEIELISKLRNMGFNGEERIQAALRDNDHDVDKTALALLHSKKSATAGPVIH